MIKSFHNTNNDLIVEIVQGDDFNQWIVDDHWHLTRLEITYTYVAGRDKEPRHRSNDRKRLPAWIILA